MLTIYKASAGSGKTFTLAYEYIKLLLGVRLEGSDRYVLNSPAALAPLGLAPVRRAHSHILAITFTNKATAEMKSRIIGELDALAHMPAADADGRLRDSAYAARLTDLFACSRQDLAEAAGRALRELLYDYGSFNVSTIDSFFQTVLRTFAREIDHQGDYRVELNSTLVLAEAVTMLFDDLNDSDRDSDTARVYKWLSGVADERVREGRDFNPFYRSGAMYADIIRSLERTFNETFAVKAAQVQDYLSDPSRMKAFEKALREEKARLWDEARLISKQTLIDAGPGIKSALASLMQGIADGSKKFSDVIKKFTSEDNTAYMAGLRGGYDCGCYRSNTKSLNYPALHEWYAQVRSRLLRISAYDLMAGAINGLWALSYINDYIARYRTENNLIILADTNSLLRSIISDDETPFIYERIGQPLRNFLIDEFQDTSRMQWLNLKPLVANSLGSDSESLIIGDVKQSIYRWRGADSSLLDTTVENSDFPRQNRVVGSGSGENTNYRSAHAVVRFNNTVFARMAEMAGVTGYGGIEQSLPENTRGLDAYITVTDVDVNDPAAILSPDQIADMALRDIEITSETAPLERLASEILAEHGRGYRWCDIAILCRAHTEAAKVVNYLLEYYPQIPLMSDEALLLANCASIKLIVSFMELLDKASTAGRTVADPMDKRADDKGDAEPVIHSRTDAEILVDRFEYFVSHGHEPHEALAAAMDLSVDSPGAAAPDASLSEDIEFIRGLAPYNIVSLIEAIIMRKLTPDRRAADMPYLTAFVDMASEWSATHIPTLHSFLAYWAQTSGKQSIMPGEGQDAVAVTTVHKAKGLEWPCVHMPLMNWKLQGYPDNQWYSLEGLEGFDPEIVPPLLYFKPGIRDAEPDAPLAAQVLPDIDADRADNLNVAYVALTRAVRELHIHTLPASKAKWGLRDALWDALEMPQPPAEAAAGDIYAPIGTMLPAPGRFVWGEPTSPVAARRKAAPAMPAPPYAVSFSQLAQEVCRLDDITTVDTALDPYIGNAPADPLAAAVDPVEPDSPVPLVLARNRGLNLHAILARMLTFDDLEAAIDAERGKLLQDEAGEDYYRQVIISAFRAHPDLTDRWFSPAARRVLVEQPIYLPQRDEGFRPDRIVWTDDGHIDIIDYKFTSTEHPEHITQVRGYANLLREMGYTGVRGYVWYPARRNVVPIPGN